MKPEDQRIAIAEACGWKCRVENHMNFQGPQNYWYLGAAIVTGNWNLPDYLNDLNAMHEAEKVLTAEQQDIYACVLEEMITPDFLGDVSELDPHIIMFRDIHATATRRAEAFLRTLGLWKDWP